VSESTQELVDQAEQTHIVESEPVAVEPEVEDDYYSAENVAARAKASGTVLVDPGDPVDGDAEQPSLAERQAASGIEFIGHDLPEDFNPDDPNAAEHLAKQASFFDSQVDGH
jgi:hypothetical protein